MKLRVPGRHDAIRTRIAILRTMTHETCSEFLDEHAEHRDHLPLFFFVKQNLFRGFTFTPLV
jgi:hypothetical protein